MSSRRHRLIEKKEERIDLELVEVEECITIVRLTSDSDEEESEVELKNYKKVAVKYNKNFKFKKWKSILLMTI